MGENSIGEEGEIDRQKVLYPGLTVPVSELGLPRRVHNKRMKRTQPPPEGLMAAQDPDSALEGSDVELGPDDFELFENILIESLSFTPGGAKAAMESYERAYYEGDDTSRRIVTQSIQSAIDASIPQEIDTQ